MYTTRVSLYFTTLKMSGLVGRKCRPAIVNVTEIRSLRTQFLCLTDTLAPITAGRIDDFNYLLRPTIAMASSNRLNIDSVRPQSRQNHHICSQAEVEALPKFHACAHGRSSVPAKSSPEASRAAI